MTITVTVAQDTPRGVFEIVVKCLSDDDAKTLMTATPSIYFTFKCNEYIREANPVHLMPGFIKLQLHKPLKENLTKNQALTLVA